MFDGDAEERPKGKSLPGDRAADDEMQELGQRDLRSDVEEPGENARRRWREEAERALSELRELMDRLQANNTPEARAEQQRAQQMMKKLNELGEISRDTSSDHRRYVSQQRESGRPAMGRFARRSQWARFSEVRQGSPRPRPAGCWPRQWTPPSGSGGRAGKRRRADRRGGGARRRRSQGSSGTASQ